MLKSVHNGECYPQQDSLFQTLLVTKPEDTSACKTGQILAGPKDLVLQTANARRMHLLQNDLGSLLMCRHSNPKNAYDKQAGMVS